MRVRKHIFLRYLTAEQRWGPPVGPFLMPLLTLLASLVISLTHTAAAQNQPELTEPAAHEFYFTRATLRRRPRRCLGATLGGRLPQGGSTISW